MSLWDEVTNALGLVGSTGASAVNMAWDLAQVPFNGTTLHDVRGDWHSTSGKGERILGNVGTAPVIGDALRLQYAAYSQGVSRPLSAFYLGASGQTPWGGAWDKAQNVSPVQAAIAGGPFMGLGTTFLNPLLNKATDSITGDPGAQGFYSAHAPWMKPGFDVTDQKQRDDAFKGTLLGKVSSGVGDATLSFVADPFSVAGGVASKSIARASRISTPLTSEGFAKLAEDAAQHDLWKKTAGAEGRRTGYGQWIEDTVKMDASQLANDRRIRASGRQDFLASALGESFDYRTNDLLYRASAGDMSARNALKEADISTWDSLNRAQGLDQSQLRILQRAREDFVTQAPDGSLQFNPDWVPLSEADNAHLDDLQKIFEDARDTNPWLKKVLDVADSSGTVNGSFGYKSAWLQSQATRRTLARSQRRTAGGVRGAWASTEFVAGPFKRPVQVLAWMGDESPSGWVNIRGVSASRSSREIQAALSKVRVWKGAEGQSKRQYWINQYLNASSAEDRAGVVTAMENAALTDMAKAYAPDVPLKDVRDFADTLHQNHARLRESATTHLQQRGFMVDEAGRITRVPTLESQLAQSIPVMDFGKYDQMLRQKFMPNAIRDFGMKSRDVFLDLHDIFNALWRPLVLLRLGYTQRNVAESGLRSLAYFGGGMNMDSWATTARRFGGNMAMRTEHVILGVAHRLDALSPMSTAKRYRGMLADAQGERNALLRELDNLRADEQVVLQRVPRGPAATHMTPDEYYNAVSPTPVAAEGTRVDMTRALAAKRREGNQLGYMGPNGPILVKTVKEIPDEVLMSGQAVYWPKHSQLVKEAIQRGERVSPEVLAGYKGLRKYVNPEDVTDMRFSEEALRQKAELGSRLSDVEANINALQRRLDFWDARERVRSGSVADTVKRTYSDQTHYRTVERSMPLDLGADAEAEIRHMLYERGGLGNWYGPEGMAHSYATSGSVTYEVSFPRGANLHEPHWSRGEDGLTAEKLPADTKVLVRGVTFHGADGKRTVKLRHPVEVPIRGEGLGSLPADLSAYRVRPQATPKWKATRGGRDAFTVGGNEFEDAFANPVAEAWSSGAPRTALDLAGPNSFLQRRIDAKLGWGEVRPTLPGGAPNPQYWDTLARVLNRQFENSPVMRMILEGKTLDELLAWSRTREGRDWARAFRLSDADAVTQKLVESADALDRYLPDAALKARLANGEQLTAKELRNALEGRDDLSPIHGPRTEEELGNPWRGLGDWWERQMQKGFKYLGTIPEDTAARHPFYRRVYQDHIRADAAKLTAQTGRKEFTLAEKRSLEKAAHAHALKTLQDTLYTIERFSNAGNVLRFVMPFYASWENSMKVWARLGVNDLSIPGHAGVIWTAPERSGMAVDENGNPVKPGQQVDGDTYIRIQLPQFGPADSPLNMALSDFSRIGFTKHSANIVFQGEPWWNPGVGPVVQLPASELVKAHPDWGGVVRGLGLAPFGASKSPLSVDTLFPPWMKKAYYLMRQQDSVEYANSMTSIMQTEMARYRNGERDAAPTKEEIKKRANMFWLVRIASNLIMPAAPTFQSENQFYIDEYRRLQRESPKDANYKFLTMYPEHYDVMASLSKNVSGMQATTAAYHAYKKYQGLADEVGSVDPSLISLLTNSEQYGDFNPDVYAWQFNQHTAGDTTTTLRETQSPAEVKAQAERNAGWAYYMKINDQLNAVLKARGLTSMQQAGAQDLAEIKAQTVQWLKDQYPEWYYDYSSYDSGKVLKTVDALDKIVTDPGFARDHQNDPKWQAVATYLDYRDQIAKILAARKANGGSGSLTAQSNADVAQVWDGITSWLAESNTGFSDLYSRYLENDTLEEVPGANKSAA